MNYENAQSIELKCRFLHRQGMLGAMYWDYDGDDENGALYDTLFIAGLCNFLDSYFCLLAL